MTKSVIADRDGLLFLQVHGIFQGIACYPAEYPGVVCVSRTARANVICSPKYKLSQFDLTRDIKIRKKPTEIFYKVRK